MKIKQNQSLTEDKSIISNLNYTTTNNNTSLNSSQTSTTPTAKQTLKKKKTSLCVSNTNEYTKMMDTQQINPDLINNQNETLNSQDTSISEEIVDDSSRTRSIGISTDTSDLAPCEPGTNILLEGIVWNETNKGVLILNVSWRGKTFVGSLIDTSKTSWAPPRFKDIPKFKNNKDGFNFFNQYGSNNLFSSTDPSFNPFVTQAGQNGLSTDPTVRTLRNGKRRFINQFENDLMSDLEFDLCNNSQNNGVSNNNNNNNNGPTTPVNQPIKQETKIKSESHSSASSVNEEEFDAMTQSSTTSSTSSKCSSKSNGKKAKLNNGDAKSTSSNSSSNSSRSYKKNKKSNLDQTLNSSNLDDTLSSSLIQGRQTPVQEQFITSQHQQQNNLTDQSTMNEIKT